MPPAHDDRLLDALSALRPTPYAGPMWRVVRDGRSPLDGSRGAGRWNPAWLSVLYGALDPNGAAAEIHFHLSLGQSVFPSRIKHLLYEMQAETERTLVFANLGALVPLGVEPRRYKEMLYGRSQEIAAAAAFLGFDGLIAPSARWTCQNIVLFLDAIRTDRLITISSEPIDWPAWRASHLSRP